MISKIKKPISILLVFMMIAGVFAAVPTAASAAEETITINSGNDKLSNHGIQNLHYGSHSDFNGNGLPWGTFVAPTGKVFTKIVTNGTDDAMNWTGSAERVDHDGMMGKWYIDYDTDTDGFRPFTISFTLADAAPPTYTVTWKNGDTVLETDTDVAKDATPEYNGATPTKAFDGKYYYDFKGWTPEITAVTGDATYTAVFEKADINYGDDNKISQDGTVDVSIADEGAIKFGLNSQTYLNMQMLGVQKKSAIATAEGDNGIRFVTAVNTNLLKGSKIEDYGYIVVKAKAGTDTTKIYDKMNNLTYGAVDENVNVFSCKGKSNTISGDFGLYDADTDYKYITLAITGTDGVDATLAARFYIKTTDGKFYYADYVKGNDTHGGMAFKLSDVIDNLG